MSVGKNFHRMNEVWIDPGHCWLISIGDNVTLAPRVTILAHDASPQAFIEATKIGNVVIGNNVFIGAGSIILPGVTIGSNVIVGAGSVVTKDLPNDFVCAGNPCKMILSLNDYMAKVNAIDKYFDSRYIFPRITKQLQKEQKQTLQKTRFALLGRNKK